MMRVFLAMGLAVSFAGLAAGGGDQKKSEFKLTDIEKKILDLTNAERVKHKLPELKPNPKLFESARAHSANMARQGKLEHVLDDMTPGQRAKKAGYRFDEIAENIAAGGKNLENIVKGWMESKVHRENILEGTYTEIGLGAVLRDDGYTYYTQVFASPKKE